MPSNLLKEAFMAAAPVLPPSAAPIPEVAPLSQGARIVNTFVAPSKTFTDLRRSASWWAPFLLLAIVSSLFAYAVGAKVGYAKAGDNIMQTRPKQLDRLEKLKTSDPASYDKTMQMVEKQTMIGTYAFPVIDLVILLIVAGLLLGTFTFVANAKVSFKVVLAIVVYASLPGALRYLLATLTLFAGVSPDGFNVQNPVATNLGILFSAVDNPVLYTVGSMIDIFALWTMTLTAIGFTCVSKVKLGTALAIVFGWYIAFILLVAGLTSLA
jgi:ABC-type multidrug transport system fused ATPase/permease subunit